MFQCGTIEAIERIDGHYWYILTQEGLCNPKIEVSYLLDIHDETLYSWHKIIINYDEIMTCHVINWWHESSEFYTHMIHIGEIRLDPRRGGSAPLDIVIFAEKALKEYFQTGEMLHA
jgi:hypothetical protein